MKIWKAELRLICTPGGKWETSFNFELQCEDYKKIESKEEWAYFKNYVFIRIPINMVVEPSGYSGLQVIQGFDHDLTQRDLKILESKMRKRLKKYLMHQKKNYLETYMKKIESISKEV
jgi:hypothetical protein